RAAPTPIASASRTSAPRDSILRRRAVSSGGFAGGSWSTGRGAPTWCSEGRTCYVLRPMIDFGLSEEQEALQRSAREFLARECPPALVRDTAKSDDGVPHDLYRKMAELGWMGLIVPEKDGGLGLCPTGLARVLDENGRG